MQAIDALAAAEVVGQVFADELLAGLEMKSLGDALHVERPAVGLEVISRPTARHEDAYGRAGCRA